MRELLGFVEDMETHEHEARRALKRPLGWKVTLIERVRLANGRPFSFDRTYLIPEPSHLVIQDVLENEPIFAVLEQRHTPIVEASYALQAVTDDADVAEELEAAVGSPVFPIERTTYIHMRRAVDYAVLHYRGDAIPFTTRLPHPRKLTCER